jgi:TPP-dependent pyruvate/acetoin dehydrogenase alpha subunit
VLSAEEADAIRDEVTAEIEAALQEALQGPEPSLEAVEGDVYA